MPMVLLRVLENRFQADVWCQALQSEGVEYLLRTYEDTAYDGLFISQKGYASLYVEESRLQRARELDEALWSQTAGQNSNPKDMAKSPNSTEAGTAHPEDSEGYATGQEAKKK